MVTEQDNPIIDKIRKLSALANAAGTEAEAANAAARVAELCQKHNLDIGAIDLEREEKQASTEDFIFDGVQYQAHWVALANACDKLFGTGHYRNHLNSQKAKYTFYGLKASVSAAIMTFSYFKASAESLWEGYRKETGATRTDRTPFLFGVGTGINERAKQWQQMNRAQLEMTDTGTALMRVEHQLVRDFYRHRGLRSAGQIRVRQSNAFEVGKAASSRVDLHGSRTNRMISS